MAKYLDRSIEHNRFNESQILHNSSAMNVFVIKGSGENEYKVHVGPKGDDGVTIHCDCRAGIFGKMCKHKLAVATGDPSLLLKRGDEARLRDVASKISKRSIGKLLENMEEARKQRDAAKRIFDKARKAVETAMKA